MDDERLMDEEEMDFEEMMQRRIQENFSEAGQGRAEASGDRLREMNKKLPAWSLEPPYSFMR